jgi:hypothetical protein
MINGNWVAIARECCLFFLFISHHPSFPGNSRVYLRRHMTRCILSTYTLGSLSLEMCIRSKDGWNYFVRNSKHSPHLLYWWSNLDIFSQQDGTKTYCLKSLEWNLWHLGINAEGGNDYEILLSWIHQRSCKLLAQRMQRSWWMKCGWIDKEPTKNKIEKLY